MARQTSARHSLSSLQTADDELEVNMTPMLDIIFIMLIFFIVSAVFVKEAGIIVERPDADSSANVKRVSALVGISADNEIWINRKQLTVEEVRGAVQKLKQENPKGKVVITADANSDSGLVVAVVRELNAIGIEGVAIATHRGNAQ